ncbi:hypothetical protein JM79_1341 [Gramella sp. Hel_I_59]|nr:hypothetical protein JM79_1341 [Gramella sp. Hel_I_59]
MKLTLSSIRQNQELTNINSLYNNLKRLLYFLLLIDLFFICLHLYTFTLPEISGSDKLLRLDMDFGYAEMFQYLQYLTAAIILLYLFFKEHKFIFLVWSFFHLVLFADDAFQFHEGFGAQFVQAFGVRNAFGLRGQDFGELAISALLGLFFALPILYHLFKGDERSQNVTIHYIILTGILIFFGVGIDILHSLLKFVPGSSVLTIVEDAGEIIAGSLIVWYSFYVLVKREIQ